MFLKRVRSEGLAHISYFLESGGEAAVIDPRRDIDDYLALSEKADARIVLVLETHRNEDLVSGALELSKVTGATVHHGSQLDFGYGSPLKDGQELSLGGLTIKAIHTPGHTYESHCFLVSDKRGPFLLFSGDTLFAGDVGRTDLVGPQSQRDLTEKLYETLHERVIPLGKELMVLPSHGAGSVCGHAISDREMTTIGLEVRDNRMLSLSREDFIRSKMNEGMEKPPYFERMETMNLHGPAILGSVPRPSTMTPWQVKEGQAAGALVLDVREPHSFAAAHVPGSLNVWLEGLPVYGGYIIPYGSPLILVTEHDQEVETAVRSLMRIGYDELLGHMRKGMEAWIKEGESTASIPVSNVQEVRARQLAGEDMLLVDLRDHRELEAGVIPEAILIHLGQLMKRSTELPLDREMVFFCNSGYRGGIAASMLRNKGITNIRVMLGGFAAWSKNGYPMEKLRSG